METTTFSVFRKFKTLEQVTEYRDLLENNGISVEMGDNVAPFDITFSGSTVQNEIELRIAIEEFEKAEKLLETQAKAQLAQLPEDYYLVSFTDQELLEVLLKPDEWNEFDYVLAQELLEQRGKPVTEKELEQMKKQRLQLLAQPEKSQKPWIIAGYFFALFGGLFGFAIGYFIWTLKKTLPNGEKVYTYSRKDRKHGMYICIFGLLMIPVNLYLRVYLPILQR